MSETPRIPLPRLPLGLPKPALAALGLGALPPLWREVRVALEAAALLREPVFHGEGVSDGGGQPVLLVPGFLAGDDALTLMTDWLRRTGHVPSRSGLRLNVDCSGASITRLERQLEQLVQREGRRAAIIGHSRGGHFAKVLAMKRPELVSGVVALGSPLLDPFAIHPLVRLQIELVGALGSLGVPVYSRSDGASSTGAPASTRTPATPRSTPATSACRSAPRSTEQSPKRSPISAAGPRRPTRPRRPADSRRQPSAPTDRSERYH
jgi:pimeloyl-ACP methyl ester carboxylesterase